MRQSRSRAEDRPFSDCNMLPQRRPKSKCFFAAATIRAALNDILQGCSAQEQKLAFDILVQLRYVLKLQDVSRKLTVLSMLHDVAVAVEHLTADH